MKKLLLICSCIFFAFTIGSAQDPRALIDSLEAKTHEHLPLETYIEYCFDIADNYMELDQYDSAQRWLNQISVKLPFKRPTISNYFLSTRQAEVYYYNGLQRLGLQESQRSLGIAKALNDSLLLADSYNFIGLFYINLDSIQMSLPYFRKGITYARQPPYPPHYLSLTKPHHLYGNMAEAHEKLGSYDSAIYYSRISLQLAEEINWKRGIAVAHYNMGIAFLRSGQKDSARMHYMESIAMAKKGEDPDVQLISLAGLARVESALNKKEAALAWLQQGNALTEANPSLNTLFQSQFLDEAITIYNAYDEVRLLATVLQRKNELLRKQAKNSTSQINAILNAGLHNETRLLNMQVEEVQQKNLIANIRLYLLIAVLIIVIAGFLFYRSKAMQKLKVAQLQNKISQDLHDDVGSSLSSVQVYSTVADKLIEREPAKAREMLQKISHETAAVMENIDDIIWSIKPEKVHSLEQRVKNFVSDVLNAANIKYTIFIEDGIEAHVKSIEARKNIILFIKEAVNNCVKHSRASYVSVTIKKLAGQLSILVVDDGVGFENQHSNRKGDGLSNMERRTLEMGGIYDVITHPEDGTTVSALIPFTKISDDH